MSKRGSTEALPHRDALPYRSLYNLRITTTLHD